MKALTQRKAVVAMVAMGQCCAVGAIKWAPIAHRCIVLPHGRPRMLIERSERPKWRTRKHALATSHRGDKPVFSAGAFLTSIAATVVSTVAIAPLNSLKLHAMDKNITSVHGLLKQLQVTDFYKGYWTAVLKFAPRHAIEHTTYSLLSQSLPHPLAGSISTACSVLLCHPLDTLHVRQVLGAKFTCDARLLMKGASPAAVQSAISGAMWYSTLQAIKGITDNPFLQCGVCALVCNVSLLPLDVIKTTCCSRGIGAMACAKELWNSGSLLAGLPTVAWTSVPCQTVAYGTYVMFRSLANGA